MAIAETFILGLVILIIGICSLICITVSTMLFGYFMLYIIPIIILIYIVGYIAEYFGYRL